MLSSADGDSTVGDQPSQGSTKPVSNLNYFNLRQLSPGVHD